MTSSALIIVKMNKKRSVSSDRSPLSKTDQLVFRNVILVDHLRLLGERDYILLSIDLESRMPTS